MVDTHKYKSLVYNIIGASMEVRNILGRGLLESVYQEALSIELATSGVHCALEQEVPIFYKDYLLDKKFRLDILVEKEVIVELKSVEKLCAEHRHQLCNYLRLTKKPVGLLINFGGSSLLGERWIYDDETKDCFMVDRNMNLIEQKEICING